MSPHKFLLLILSIILLAACTVADNHQDDVYNSNAYRADAGKIYEENVEIYTALKDDLENGELILLLKVKNNSEEKIRVDYLNCSLSIDAERVVIPEIKGTFKSELAPGEEERYEITYHPINTVDFYFRSDYRGDMRQQYSLKLDFIVDDQGKQIIGKEITFKLSDAAYQNYISRYAREQHMQIFDFDFDSEVFASQQLDYLKNLLPVQNGTPEHSVLAITPSITINQVIINSLCYQYKDTLMVNMRMLNQGSHNIQVSLENSTVKISDQTFSANNHFSDSFVNGRLPDSTYIVKPGTRLHLLLKYHVPFKVDRWELSNNFILLHDRNAAGTVKEWKNLLYRDLSFKESMITRDIM
jgi:hypothetical protein